MGCPSAVCLFGDVESPGFFRENAKSHALHFGSDALRIEVLSTQLLLRLASLCCGVS